MTSVIFSPVGAVQRAKWKDFVKALSLERDVRKHTLVEDGRLTAVGYQAKVNGTFTTIQIESYPGAFYVHAKSHRGEIRKAIYAANNAAPPAKEPRSETYW